MRMLLGLCISIAALPAAAALREQLIEFHAGPHAAQPSVAVERGYGFVLTWQEREAGRASLHFARFDEGGRERGRGRIGEGDDWFVNGADFPNLAVLDNGDWVTFWLQKTSPGTYSYEIRLVRSRDRGASWDAPIVIHRDGSATEHGFVSLLPDGGDVVRAVWLDGRRMADAEGGHDGAEHMSLRSAALARDGRPYDEVELDDLTCACCQTDALRMGERMIVAYRDRTPTEQRDIHWLERRAATWSAPRSVHADGWVINACPVNGPAIAGAGERNAVLWPTMAGGEMQVKFKAGIDSDSAARTLAAGADELGRVDLAAWGDGWLATRVATRERLPTLLLSAHAADGSVRQEFALAARVGGYPRLAVAGDVALVAWAEAGREAGTSRIGLARVVRNEPGAD